MIYNMHLQNRVNFNFMLTLKSKHERKLKEDSFSICRALKSLALVNGPLLPKPWYCIYASKLDSQLE